MQKDVIVKSSPGKMGTNEVDSKMFRRPGFALKFGLAARAVKHQTVNNKDKQSFQAQSWRNPTARILASMAHSSKAVNIKIRLRV
jgi:hypothetical protein